ncbi:MAG: sensor histidine kinase [Gordonia sp. (in: high G+C Gram-positive bacteria)]|uniref:sensor histidine kinase n=1 Tax=Gordonia sp. (in: high G+C Gram-positive bacteria) TaxID=84139 RepID=UPI0039E66DBB
MTADTRQDLLAPWRDVRWVFAAIWLLFLGYPIAAVFGDGVTPEHRWIGLGLILAFALVYLLVCVYVFGPRVQSVRIGLGAVVVLAGLTLAMIPFIGSNAIACLPYLIGASSFLVSPRVLAVIVALTVAAVIAIPELAGKPVDVTSTIVVAVVGIILLLMRLTRDSQRAREAAEERQRAVDSQLAVVAERERVARDVHDILGHSLTVISVKSELAGRLLDSDPDRAKQEIAEVNALSREALSQVRATVGALRTPELPDVLAGAESALTAAGIDADLPTDTRAAGPHGQTYAWVLREAVTNVVRHSGATRCRVAINPSFIEIADDGQGSPMLTYGTGLRGLAERVEQDGGRLTVDSDENGTTVRAGWAR